MTQLGLAMARASGTHIQTHNVGFPHMGDQCELKFSLPDFWLGNISECLRNVEAGSSAFDNYFRLARGHAGNNDEMV